MGTDGLCTDETNPFGPVHAYVAPLSDAVVSCKGVPTHTAPPFAALGVEGIALTVAVVLLTALVQPFTVTVSE